MNYRKSKGKWVINKDGVYFSLTDEELLELENIINDIKSGENKFYLEDARCQPKGESTERPVNCRNRLRDEGRAYPRSGCYYCKTGGLTGCPFDKPKGDV